jgi:hypothetical protein
MKKGQGIDSQSKNSQNNWLEFSGIIGEFAQMRGRIPCEIGENSWVYTVDFTLHIRNSWSFHVNSHRLIENSLCSRDNPQIITRILKPGWEFLMASR